MSWATSSANPHLPYDAGPRDVEAHPGRQSNERHGYRHQPNLGAAVHRSALLPDAGRGHDAARPFVCGRTGRRVYSSSPSSICRVGVRAVATSGTATLKVSGDPLGSQSLPVRQARINPRCKGQVGRDSQAGAGRLGPSMLHVPALPFTLRRSNGVISGKEITSTVETIHGLLRVDGDSLVLQWRVQRQTDRVGSRDPQRSRARSRARGHDPHRLRVRRRRPLAPVAFRPRPLSGPDRGRSSRLRGIDRPRRPRVAHPAQLVLDVRKQDNDAARELATQVELAIGDHALRIAEGDAVAAPALAGEQAGRKLLGPGGG